MFPKPTADPAAAKMKPILEPHAPLFSVLDIPAIRLFVQSEETIIFNLFLMQFTSRVQGHHMLAPHSQEVLRSHLRVCLIGDLYE